MPLADESRSIAVEPLGICYHMAVLALPSEVWGEERLLTVPVMIVESRALHKLFLLALSVGTAQQSLLKFSCDHDGVVDQGTDYSADKKGFVSTSPTG